MNCWHFARVAIVCTVFAASALQAKERIIVTSDGEVDDKASLIRLLVYANEIDIDGLIYSNSQFHHAAVSPISNHRRGANGWIEQSINRYESNLANLRVHATGWPNPGNLRSVIKNGNLGAAGGGSGSTYDNGAVGEGWDTEGSNHIIEALLDSDRRRVWLQAWGGLSTIAQAFYRLRASYSQTELDYAIEKARVYAVVEQEDATPYGSPRFGLTGRNSEWLQRNFPSLRIIQPLVQPWLFAYMGDGVGPGRNMGINGGAYADAVNPYYNDYIYQSAWYGSNVAGHGVLGRYYQPASSEGDSLAFFHVLNNGLRGFENPTWGGWGGRMRSVGVNFWTDAYDDGNRGKGFWRWVYDLQSDFAARMDWALFAQYSQANHHPVIADATLRRSVAPGQQVSLSVSASDPDNNGLFYRWYHYRNAGDEPYTNAQIALSAASSANASLVVPSDALNKEIHVIVEVKDNGIGHPLKSYRRFILDVTGAVSSNPAPTPAPTSAPVQTPAPTPTVPARTGPVVGAGEENNAAPGSNLLRNTGFEDGTTMPWRPWGGFSVANNNAARSGSWAVQVASGSGGGTNVTTVKSGGRYVYSAWGKSSNGRAGAVIGYKFYTGSFVQVGKTVTAPSFSANYEQRSLRFEVPAAAAYVQVMTWNSTGAAAYLDDVSLIDEQGGTAAPEPPAVATALSVATPSSAAGSGLIANGGFEAGRVTPWSVWGSFSPIRDGNAHSGLWAVRVLPGNGGGTNIVSVTPGARYIYEAWGKANKGTGAVIGLKFFDNAYNQIGPQQLSNSFTSSYSQRSISFQVPANASYVQVFGWNASAGSMYLDDASLFEY